MDRAASCTKATWSLPPFLLVDGDSVIAVISLVYNGPVLNQGYRSWTLFLFLPSCSLSHSSSLTVPATFLIRLSCLSGTLSLPDPSYSRRLYVVYRRSSDLHFVSFSNENNLTVQAKANPPCLTVGFESRRLRMTGQRLKPGTPLSPPRRPRPLPLGCSGHSPPASQRRARFRLRRSYARPQLRRRTLG